MRVHLENPNLVWRRFQLTFSGSRPSIVYFSLFSVLITFLICRPVWTRSVHLTPDRAGCGRRNTKKRKKKRKRKQKIINAQTGSIIWKYRACRGRQHERCRLSSGRKCTVAPRANEFGNEENVQHTLTESLHNVHGNIFSPWPNKRTSDGTQSAGNFRVVRPYNYRHVLTTDVSFWKTGVFEVVQSNEGPSRRDGRRSFRFHPGTKMEETSGRRGRGRPEIPSCGVCVNRPQ